MKPTPEQLSTIAAMAMKGWRVRYGFDAQAAWDYIAPLVLEEAAKEFDRRQLKVIRIEVDGTVNVDASAIIRALKPSSKRPLT